MVKLNPYKQNVNMKSDNDNDNTNISNIKMHHLLNNLVHHILSYHILNVIIKINSLPICGFIGFSL